MKQYISVIMALVFFWANTAWAAKLPGPKSPPLPETQTASDDTFLLTAEPMLSWTNDNYLVICKANCGIPKPDMVYALYQGQGFPARTYTRIVPVQASTPTYIIQYRLEGNASFWTITMSMLVSQPPKSGPTSGPANRPASGSVDGSVIVQPNMPANLPATAPDGTPILQVQYKYFAETSTIIFGNEDYYGMIWGVIKKNNGEIIGHNMFINDKKTGMRTLSTNNVDIKITHWAELAKTLGIVAGITTTVGMLAFWTPGIIVAATPVFP